MEEKFIYEIKSIHIDDVIEKVGGGYSGALLYKVTSGNNCFFLKILKWKLIKEKNRKNCFYI